MNYQIFGESHGPAIGVVMEGLPPGFALDLEEISRQMGRRRAKGDGLTVVGSGEVSISDVRWLPKGHPVGSTRPVVLKKPTRIAVLPVGYQNGFGVERPRERSLGDVLRRWWSRRSLGVRIGGQRARILGAIGATETIVDVTDLRCSAGDVACFDIDPMFARGLQRIYR